MRFENQGGVAVVHFYTFILVTGVAFTLEAIQRSQRCESEGGICLN